MATKNAVVKFDSSAYPVLNGNTDELKAVLEENIGGDTLSEFDIDRVKVPTGGVTIWEVPTLEGSVHEEVLEGIIVAHFRRRAFWSGEYAGGNEPPACVSLDAVTGVGEPGGECAACPFSQWGSSTKDESPNGQACKEVRQIFLLQPGAMIPTVVTLPPTSLTGARQYLLRLTKNLIPHTGVITKLSLEKDKSGAGFEYARVVLTAGERLPDEERQKIVQYAEALMPSFQRVSVTSSDIGGDDQAV